MKNILKKYTESYKRYGLISFINRIFLKFKIKIHFNDPIQKKRIYLSKKINELCKGEVIDGIYKGSKFIYSSDYFIAKPAQLLGCYEKEVQEKIFELSKKNNLNFFISIGAGEGYHAVGSRVSNLFTHSFSFELEKKNRLIVEKNFTLNSINNNYTIYGKAEIFFLESIKKKIEFKKSLFLFDIEGDEFKILNKENIRQMKDSILIVELHHFYSTKEKQKELIDNLDEFFNVSFIKTEKRQYSNFDILDRFNDDEKWLMMSESRPSTMMWLICEPK